MLARRGSDSTLRQAELGAGHEGLVGRFVIAGVLEALGQVCVQPLQRPQQLLLAEVAA